jgi:hypothetical protein
MTIPAWTFSQLEKFETCPRQFYHVRVKRDVVEVAGEHAVWGHKVHSALELRLLSGTPLPEGMQQWESFVSKIEKMPGEKLCEQKFALDDSFQPTDWNTAWSRGIADVVVKADDTAIVLDYKTGKRKLTDQLQLYAGYMFAFYPELDSVSTGFVWLKDRKIDKETYTRQDVPMIWQAFLPRVRKLESAYERDSWPCRPSGLCRGWCPVKSCEFYKDKG